MTGPTYRLAVGRGSTATAKDTLELAGIAGLPALDGWQQQVVRDWMRTDRAGLWVHNRGLLLVPRQNGKSVLAVIRALAGLYLLGETVLLSAHRAKVAGLMFRQIVDAIETTPELMARTKTILKAHGLERVDTTTGGRLYVGSRVSSLTSSARGDSIDTLIADEALVIGTEWLASALPAMSARPNPQVLLLSSAGDASSLVLAQWRAAAYAGTAGMRAHEWAAPDELPHDDPATWKVANPAYPKRISAGAIRTELATLTPHAFARERLGRWSTSTVEPAVPAEAYLRCVSPDVGRPPTGKATLAVDVSVDPQTGERHAALAAAWPADGRTAVVLIASGPGTEWLPGKAAEAAARLNTARVHFCPGSAADVAAAMAHQGLEVVRVPFGQLKGAAPGLVEHMALGRVTIQESDPLTVAVRTTPRRGSGDGSWTFGRPASGAQAPLVAVSLAVHTAQTTTQTRPQIW